MQREKHVSVRLWGRVKNFWMIELAAAKESKDASVKLLEMLELLLVDSSFFFFGSSRYSLLPKKKELFFFFFPYSILAKREWDFF